MSKRTKVIVISVCGIALVAIMAVFIFLMGVRREFTNYLDTKYPQTSFKTGFTKIDFIYGKYFAKVNSKEDGTIFPISKSWNTKSISDDYEQYKSINQYNAKIKNVFEGSSVKQYIVNITGGAKIPFEDNAAYDQIYIRLAEKIDHISAAKKILNVLKEKNISAERVIFEYGKDNGVYRLVLSSKDFGLTEKEIESRIEKIK